MQTFTNHKSLKKENTGMTAISVILAKPDGGKEEQAKERMKHRAKIMSNNGFTTRVAEGFSGPTAGHLAVQAMTEDWTAMGTALTKMAADPEFIEWQQKMDEIHGQADLLIMKQRHGPTGNIKLSFDAKYTRFGNFISKDHTNNYE